MASKAPPRPSRSERNVPQQIVRSADRAALAGIPLFAGTDDGLFRRLLAAAEFKSHRSGTILFEQGAKADKLHVLLRGQVELYVCGDNRECGIMLLSAGDLFMPAASLFEAPYLNSARVISRARVAAIGAGAVRAEAASSPELAMGLAQTLAGHFRMAVRHVIDLKCRSAPQRLAAFLLRLINDGPMAAHAQLPAPKKVLAARVGMSPETFSRTLQVIAEHGLVVRGHRIELRDRRRIERFIGPRLYSEDSEDALDVFVL